MIMINWDQHCQQLRGQHETNASDENAYLENISGVKMIEKQIRCDRILDENQSR